MHNIEHWSLLLRILCMLPLGFVLLHQIYMLIRKKETNGLQTTRIIMLLVVLSIFLTLFINSYFLINNHQISVLTGPILMIPASYGLAYLYAKYN